MGPNQPPPFENVNLFTSDLPLREAVSRAGVDASDLAAFGAEYGSAETMELGRLANENPPRLRVFEPNGERADRVEFHPAWHALMRKSMAAGLHDSTGDVVERAARLYMATQIEAGHICPLTMTSAAGAALKAAPEILDAWRPYTTARDYDGAFRPWFTKKSATLGMGMTERQSGTDVRATISEARPINGRYEITGHKWFLSAPMSDGFLVLAQAPSGLTCFLLPRFRPDGGVNALRLQRLKDKLGNRSNASAEVEFIGAYAERIGAEGERRSHHPQHGAADAARLRHRGGGADAFRIGAGGPSRAPSFGLRASPDRAAADARSARSARACERSQHSARVPPRPRLCAARLRAPTQGS